MEKVQPIIQNCPHCGERVETDITQASIDKAGGAEQAAHMAIITKCYCDGSKKELKSIKQRNFNGFVGSDLLTFMEQHGLQEISVKMPNGNTAKLKEDKHGNVNSMISIKETL